MLETRSARLRLPVQKKPHFVKIGVGLAIGYRRNQTAGSWIVRRANGAGANATKAIGLADDYDDADGERVLDYWQAQEKARGVAGDHRSARTTIIQALDAYEANLRTRGADTQNAARARLHLTPALGKKDAATAESRELRRWRDGLAATLSPATVNRVITGLKAAFNLAAEDDRRIADNRSAWENGLAAIPDAQQSRNVILPETAVRAIVAAAYQQSTEFGLLVEVAAITGARVSQIARLQVQDLQADRDTPRLTMPTSLKGRGKKTAQHRPVPIPLRLATRLQSTAAGRASTAPLLVKPSGDPWCRSDHYRPFARAANSAGEDPATATIYALRHSNIVRQLLAGVPARVVAVNHDTSIAMLERTYSRHIGDHADALARPALLNIAT
jgi:integrase